MKMWEKTIFKTSFDMTEYDFGNSHMKSYFRRSNIILRFDMNILILNLKRTKKIQTFQTIITPPKYFYNCYCSDILYEKIPKHFFFLFFYFYFYKKKIPKLDSFTPDNSFLSFDHFILKAHTYQNNFKELI